MASKGLSKAPGVWAAMVLAVLLMIVACSSPAREESQNAPAAELTTTPASPWSALLQRTPFAYTIPLPPPTPTILDGTYTKFELKEGARVPCKRCPDYAVEGGIWRLNLDKGVYRVYHEATGWRSIGSFVMSRDRESSVEFPDKLVLFNDPTCPGVVGMYIWKVEGGRLILQVIDDTCSFGLRAVNLTHLDWLACHPPSTEATVTGHWEKPPGCP